jgi:hypothetical protein
LYRQQCTFWLMSLHCAGGNRVQQSSLMSWYASSSVHAQISQDLSPRPACELEWGQTECPWHLCGNTPLVLPNIMEYSLRRPLVILSNHTFDFDDSGSQRYPKWIFNHLTIPNSMLPIFHVWKSYLIIEFHGLVTLRDSCCIPMPTADSFHWITLW